MNLLQLSDDILYLIGKKISIQQNKRLLNNEIKKNVLFLEQCCCFHYSMKYKTNTFFCLSNVKNRCKFIKSSQLNL